MQFASWWNHHFGVSYELIPHKLFQFSGPSQKREEMISMQAAHSLLILDVLSQAPLDVLVSRSERSSGHSEGAT